MRSNGKIFSSLAILALAALPALADGVVGAAAPAFTLKGLDGKNHSLADYKGKVVVLEWINPNCPVSNRHAREKTMTELVKQHGEVVWLGINSTSPSSGDFMKPAEHLAYNQKYGIAYPCSTTRAARSATPTARGPRRTCSSSPPTASSPTTARSTTTRRGARR